MTRNVTVPRNTSKDESPEASRVNAFLLKENPKPKGFKCKPPERPLDLPEASAVSNQGEYGAQFHLAGVLCLAVSVQRLNFSECLEIASQMKLFEFPKAMEAVTIGEMGIYFFVVDGDSSFEVVIDGKAVASVGPWKGFGEIALMHDSCRTATVRASRDGSRAWGLDKATFSNALKLIAKRAFAENLRFLNKIDILAPLSASHKNLLANSVKEKLYKIGEHIVRQGEVGYLLFFIKSGCCLVFDDETRLEMRRLYDGEYFGERALLYNEPRSASVIAERDSLLLSIDRRVLETAIGSFKEMLFANMIHRALSSSVSAAQAKLDNTDGDRTPPCEEPPVPSQEGTPTLRLGLSMGETARISKATITKIVKEMRWRDYPPLYCFMEPDRRLKNVRYFVVLEGKVVVSENNRAVAVINRGGYFGREFLSNPEASPRYRADTVMASRIALMTDETLIANFSSGVSQLMKQYETERALRLAYIFRILPEAGVTRLAQSVSENVYQPGDSIVRLGEPGNTFLVIKSGEVSIRIRPKGATDPNERLEVRRIGKGDYLGERSLLNRGERRSADCVAITNVVTWVLDDVSFGEVVRGPTILNHLKKRIELQDARFGFTDLQVVHVIGRGGFGTVAKVRGQGNDTDFAIKMVSKQHLIAEGLTASTANERELMAAMDHPFVTKSIRAFVNDRFLFFFGELITGGELSQALEALRKYQQAVIDAGLLSTRPLPKALAAQMDSRVKVQSITKQAVFYAASMLKALEYFHERNIIYRDLKPENVMLDSDGFIKIIDFGASKRLDVEGRTHTTVGTPAYMAPEVFIGKGYGVTADLWSLGVALYFIVTGSLPFEGYRVPWDLEHGDPKPVPFETATIFPNDEMKGSNGEPLAMIRRILTAPLLWPGETLSRSNLDVIENISSDGDRPVLRPGFVKTGRVVTTSTVGPEVHHLKSFISRLLCRVPEARMGAGAVSDAFSHPIFEGFEHDKLLLRQQPAPFVPNPDTWEASDASQMINSPLSIYEKRLAQELGVGDIPVRGNEDWLAGFEVV